METMKILWRRFLSPPFFRRNCRRWCSGRRCSTGFSSSPLPAHCTRRWGQWCRCETRPWPNLRVRARVSSSESEVPQLRLKQGSYQLKAGRPRTERPRERKLASDASLYYVATEDMRSRDCRGGERYFLFWKWKEPKRKILKIWQPVSRENRQEKT